MLRFAWVLLCAAGFVPAVSGLALAESLTPASNLAGIKQVRDRIDVSLKLKGADEFAVDASEVIKIVRSALASSGISLTTGDYKMPGIYIAITGESAGGGGAEFNVDLSVRALVPSPFAKERSIEAIIWQTSARGRHLMRFDPASKGLVKPGGTIRDRVYDSVRDAATRLVTDFKAAGA